MNAPVTTPKSIMQIPMHLLSPKNLLDARLGEHDYDIIVGLMTRFQPHVIAHQMAMHYSKDFEAAATRLDQIAYQVLRVSGSLSIYNLADPLFDPSEKLCLHLECPDTLDSIKADLIADAIDIDATLSTITAVLQTMNADQAKAVWASVAFGQTAPLSDYERLTAPWWTARFICQWGSETW